MVSDWYVGFSVGFSEWQSSRAGSHRRPDVTGLRPFIGCEKNVGVVESDLTHALAGRLSLLGVGKASSRITDWRIRPWV
jgi:hypothetical protein